MRSNDKARHIPVPAALVGVIGTNESLERILGQGEIWWCVPQIADIGTLVIMYCTRHVSNIHQGMLGLYKLIDIDRERDIECRKYGASSGYSDKPMYATLRRVKKFKRPLRLEVLRKNLVLTNAQFMRRNFQGTFFSVRKHELEEILRLATENRATTSALKLPSGRKKSS